MPNTVRCEFVVFYAKQSGIFSMKGLKADQFVGTKMEIERPRMHLASAEPSPVYYVVSASEPSFCQCYIYLTIIQSRVNFRGVITPVLGLTNVFTPFFLRVWRSAMPKIRFWWRSGMRSGLKK